MKLKESFHFARGKSGFTLLELMVVIAIIAVLATVAIAGLSNAIPRYQVKSAAQELRSDLQKAKMEAVKSNREALVVFTAGDSGSFKACFDDNDDGSCDKSNDTIIANLNFSDYRHAAVGDVSSAFTNGPYFRFNARGMPEADSGAFSSGTVNINCSSDSNYSISIVLSRTGRIQIQ